MAIRKQETKGTLNVTGEGEVKVKPDIATVSLGVIAQASTAAHAIALAADRMGHVVDAVKAEGVPAADIQTAGFTVMPVTNPDKTSPDYGSIVGYQVEDQVTVRVDPASAGMVIDAAGAAGANVVGGIAFGLRDEAPARTMALQKAAEAATRDADATARSLKVAPAGIMSVDLLSSSGMPMYRTMTASGAGGTPIEPGMLTVTARVNVVFALRAKR